MTQSEVRIAWQPLHEFTKEVFVRTGMPVNDAATVADVLTWANLRGVDSHGVLRILIYLDNVDKGWMNPNPNIQITKETAATLLIDGDRAFGPVVTTFAMEKVMEKAKNAGIGWALLNKITHQGAMGYYTLKMAEKGMAGIDIVCNPPNMVPHGAKAPGVHNSPISIAAPAARNQPLVLDMATSVVAQGKLLLAIDRGASIPDSWALDSDGNPTTDPKKAVHLMPVGGPKGSGMALLFECLSSVMVGRPLLEAILLGQMPRQHTQNGIIAAIDISTFTDLQEYKQHIDNLIDALKALPKAEGYDEIMMPGEPENRTLEERTRNGIPLPPGTVDKLKQAAARFDIKLPEGL